MDWQYAGRNNWLAGVQDPATVQYSPETYTLSSTSFASARGGLNIGNWQVALFCDNLFDSRTTTNYQLSQVDANNPGTQTVQENAWTWRPRTIGITASFRR